MPRPFAFLMLALPLTGCAIVQPAAPFNGDATEFAGRFKVVKVALECAEAQGVELISQGSGGGGGGGRASWTFNLGFLGDEEDRAALMQALEPALDESLELDELRIVGRGSWNGIPGFRRTYESASQRGFFTVHSTVTVEGMVYVRGEGQELPR